MDRFKSDEKIIKCFVFFMLIVLSITSCEKNEDDSKVFYEKGILLTFQNNYYILLDRKYDDYEDPFFKLQPAMDKEGLIDFEEYNNGNIVEISFATIGALELPVIDVLSIRLIDDSTKITEDNEKIINELIEKYKPYMF